MRERDGPAGTDESRPRTETQVSAGGVAFRRTTGDLEVALVCVGPKRRWQLPKGIVEAGETPGQAAVREVREEAGIDGELLDLLDVVEYWYVATKSGRRVRYHKFVHFFLIAHRSGDPSLHDHEVVDARWVRASDAIAMLTFPSERRVVELALARLAAQDSRPA